MSGKLTVKGGTIAGGNAQQGGGIYVDVLGDLTLDGCTVSGNTAPQGGGVFVTGKLTLMGNTVVENNTDGNGNDSNIFLSSGNKVVQSGFTGRAGISVVSRTDPFATEDAASTGVFFSDDKGYTAENDRLSIARLASVKAEAGEGKLFVTATPEQLKNYVKVTGTNVNGAPYVGEIAYTVTGELVPGPCELTVSASGEGGEQVEPVTLTVDAAVPSLVSIEAVPPETLPKIYFDSPLSALAAGGYIFRGVYDDGNSRDLSPKTGEEEGDFYTLMGDFSHHPDGKASVVVSVGNVSTAFEVEISKRTVVLSEDNVMEQSVLEGGSVDVRAFVPTLPAGIAISATLGGSPLAAASLAPGTYTVELSFTADEENYEEIPVRLDARLTVLRKQLSAQLGGGTVTVTKEGGLAPSWTLKTEEITGAESVRPGEGLEARRLYELTLEEDGLAVEHPGTLTVRLPIPEELAEEKVTLYLLNEDGSVAQVNAERADGELRFTVNLLSHARYVLAVETASQVYLVLSIVFGVACVLGAAAVVGYVVVKRKKH